MGDPQSVVARVLKEVPKAPRDPLAVARGVAWVSGDPQAVDALPGGPSPAEPMGTIRPIVLRLGRSLELPVELLGERPLSVHPGRCLNEVDGIFIHLIDFFVRAVLWDFGSGKRLSESIGEFVARPMVSRFGRPAFDVLVGVDVFRGSDVDASAQHVRIHRRIGEMVRASRAGEITGRSADGLAVGDE